MLPDAPANEPHPVRGAMRAVFEMLGVHDPCLDIVEPRRARRVGGVVTVRLEGDPVETVQAILGGEPSVGGAQFIHLQQPQALPQGE